MSWKNDCYARGGFATVFPHDDPTYGVVAGEPACRLPDRSYVYMESVFEHAERNADLSSDRLAISLGNLVAFRDRAVAAVGSFLSTGLLWGIIGLSVFLFATGRIGGGRREW